jgi:hypothetical protein
MLIPETYSIPTTLVGLKVVQYHFRLYPVVGLPLRPLLLQAIVVFIKMRNLQSYVPQEPVGSPLAGFGAAALAATRDTRNSPASF